MDCWCSASALSGINSLISPSAQYLQLIPKKKDMDFDPWWLPYSTETVVSPLIIQEYRAWKGSVSTMRGKTRQHHLYNVLPPFCIDFNRQVSLHLRWWSIPATSGVKALNEKTDITEVLRDSHTVTRVTGSLTWHCLQSDVSGDEDYLSSSYVLCFQTVWPGIQQN